jgi:hypothetical protein
MIDPLVTFGFVIEPELVMPPPERFAIEHEYVPRVVLAVDDDVVVSGFSVVVVVVNAGCANK